jgi:putative transposase
MTSKPVAELLADLGIGRTHSRPHVSNDNPYSEAAFKTLKYCPAFPERFGSIADARVFCERFSATATTSTATAASGCTPPLSMAK